MSLPRAIIPGRRYRHCPARRWATALFAVAWLALPPTAALYSGGPIGGATGARLGESGEQTVTQVRRNDWYVWVQECCERGHSELQRTQERHAEDH